MLSFSKSGRRDDGHGDDEGSDRSEPGPLAESDDEVEVVTQAMIDKTRREMDSEEEFDRYMASTVAPHAGIGSVSGSTPARLGRD